MNKFLFFITALLTLNQFANAQTSKGNQTLGVSLGFNKSNTDSRNVNPFDNSSYSSTNKSTRLDAGPTYSYFIADNLDLGTNLFYSSEKYENSGGNYSFTSQTNRSYGANIYLRKYFMYGKVGFRTGPSVGYNRGTLETTNLPGNEIYNYDSKSSNFNAGVNLDLLFYPTKRLGLAASVASARYNHFKSEDPSYGDSSGDSFGLNLITNGLYFSLFYTFGN